MTGLLSVSTFDVDVYRRYGEAIVAGSVPYRDLAIEYPPGSLALFALPALVTDGAHSYRIVFAGTMLLAVAATLAGVRRLERRMADPSTIVPLVLAFGLIALLGSVALTRFDLVPAALSVAALLALRVDRRFVAALALGAAIAVKLYPLVLLPVIAIHVARREGARAAALVSGLALSIAAVAYLPFLAWSASGTVTSFKSQLSRSLQVESLAGSLFAAVHRVFAIDLPSQTTYYDFPDGSADVVATASVGVGCAVLVALWVAQARSTATDRSLLRYSAAAIATFVTFGKVLSPQYLLWLIPLVVLVGGRRGRLAAGLLACACLLTAAVFPRHFNALQFDLAATPLALIVLRDLLLVALVAVLGWPGTATDAESLERASIWPRT